MIKVQIGTSTSYVEVARVWIQARLQISTPYWCTLWETGVPVVGSCYPCGKHRLSSWLLVLAWPNPNCATGIWEVTGIWELHFFISKSMMWKFSKIFPPKFKIYVKFSHNICIMNFLMISHMHGFQNYSATNWAYLLIPPSMNLLK